MPREVLVVVVSCPNCGAGFYGAWLEPAALGEDVEACLQECPSCATRTEMEYPL
jgi:uncharacterized protein (UPF0212 family)